MRIVVTGAGGGLGAAVVAAAPAHHDVIALSHADLDVGDHEAVFRTMPALGADLVINCAGFTAVDANESDVDRAFRDNAVIATVSSGAVRDSPAKSSMFRLGRRSETAVATAKAPMFITA